MKKIFSIFIVIICIASCLILNLSAKGEEETYTDLGKYLNNNGWPSFVSAYYYLSTGYDPNTPDVEPHSEIVVYVTNEATEKDKEMIKGIIKDFDIVTFKGCTHSNDYYTDLAGRIVTDERLGWYITTTYVGIKEDDTFLVIYVNEDKYDYVLSILEKDYSSELPFIEAKKGQVNDFTQEVPEGSYEIAISAGVIAPPPSDNTYSGNNNLWIYYAIVVPLAVLIIIGSTLLVLRNRKKRVLQSANGNVTFDDSSYQSVKEEIKEGNEPSDELYTKIMDKIE